MKAEIKNSYAVPEAWEISIDWNGWNFLVICGKHINGWFIAIPNWRICVEASEPEDTFYNTEKLARALNDTCMGQTIAQAIKEYWEETEG